MRIVLRSIGLHHLPMMNISMIILLKFSLKQKKVSHRPEDDGPKFDEEITYVSQDASLVDCFRLSTVLAKEEISQRNNIFHAKCIVQGKGSDVILNGGSCENMVAITMVEKLSFNTKGRFGICSA